MQDTGGSGPVLSCSSRTRLVSGAKLLPGPSSGPNPPPWTGARANFAPNARLMLGHHIVSLDLRGEFGEREWMGVEPTRAASAAPLRRF